MCKIGSRPIGNLNFETKKIYLLGNARMREDYSWFKENKRMAEGKGVEKCTRTYIRFW